MTTLHVIKSMRRSPCRRGFLFILIAVGCLALSPTVRAVCREGCDLANANTFLGDDVLLNNATGFNNTAVGWRALYSNTTGINNTANGGGALLSNSTGSYNTANGVGALTTNTVGDNNTANGSFALEINTTGSGNTATGVNALENNSTGYGNTASGSFALMNNTTGLSNTASGEYALISNTTGSNNTANGGFTLASNTNGFQNTATGRQALQHNRAGSRNTANGYAALWSNHIGTNNTADGFQTLYNNTGSNNVGLGFNAGSKLTTGSGNVCIGSGIVGVAGESNTTRVRNVYTSVASGRAVYVNSDNKIGALSSSRRFKEEIKAMEKASETVLALKPVTFRYKKEIDARRTKQFGLVAEEVEKVDPDLVTRDEEGKPESVRYDAINAMLLNEFLKEHKRVEEQAREIQKQKNTISELRKGMDSVVARLEEQASQKQNVSAQLELSKGGTQTVADKR